MSPTEAACASFIVRLRREPGDGWRGAIEDVASGARLSFSGLEGMLPLVRSLVDGVSAAPVPSAPEDDPGQVH
jgi:hypothetical protein